MPYAILRFQKCKTGGVTARYIHNERKKDTYKSNPDISTARKPENYHLVLPTQTYRREVQRMIKSAGCRTRKDSTVMVETLITASPEFMNTLPPKEQREYFERALSFVGSRVGRENIIAAVVHMDEKTPHMHLCFIPITPEKRLSAKTMLGNQAQLSKWQTDYHNTMSTRWPELERGISSIDTGRRHIPVWLFKLAERLDKRFVEVQTALADINVLNAGKKRDKAMRLLHEWLPRAERFSAEIKLVDKQIKALEQKERDAQERIANAEAKGERTADGVIAQMQTRMGEITKLLREERERSDKLRCQCRNQETLIGKIPLELREKLMAPVKPQERNKAR